MNSPRSDAPVHASPSVMIIPVPVGSPVQVNDDVGRVLVDALAQVDCALRDGDIVAVASKVVALGEGAIVTPAQTAPLDPGTTTTVEDPRRTLARTQAARIVADAPQALVVATSHGFVCANAGIDASNIEAGLLLLPADPDASAARLRAHLRTTHDVDVAVVVTDTFGRPWRMGQTDVALGVAGMTPLRDERGSLDLHGRRLDVTVAAIADEVASAADLVRTKASAVPFVVLRGLDLAGSGSGAELVRPLDQDLFPVGGPTMFDHAVTHMPPRTHGQDPAAVLQAMHDAVAVVRANAPPDTQIDVTLPGQTHHPVAAVTVTSRSGLAAGVAAERVRIALAGRGIGVAPIEPAITNPADQTVRVVLVPTDDDHATSP